MPRSLLRGTLLEPKGECMKFEVLVIIGEVIAESLLNQ